NETISPWWQLADTVSVTAGTHSFQTGFEAVFAFSRSYNSGGTATVIPTVQLGIGGVPVPGINNTNFPGLNSNDIGTAENLLANLAGSIASIEHQFYINSPDA